MGKEIIFFAYPSKVLGKETIEIFYGIALPGKDISITGKEIIFLTYPSEVMGKEIIDIS